MKKKTRLLIIKRIIFVLVIIVSFKIFNGASFKNLFASKIINQPYCKGCNVILISLDTLSANHLPCYGYERNTAPNLCKFGRENIMFKNAFSNAPWTLPSNVSIFTGLLQVNIKLPNLIKALYHQRLLFCLKYYKNWDTKHIFL